MPRWSHPCLVFPQQCNLYKTIAKVFTVKSEIDGADADDDECSYKSW